MRSGALSPAAHLRAPAGPLGGAPPSLGIDAVGSAPTSASGRPRRPGADGRRESVDPSDGAQGADQRNPLKSATGTFEPPRAKRAAEVPTRSRPSARRELLIAERLVTSAFGPPGLRAPATRREPRAARDALATCPPRPMRAPAAARLGCAAGRGREPPSAWARAGCACCPWAGLARQPGVFLVAIQLPYSC